MAAWAKLVGGQGIMTPWLVCSPELLLLLPGLRHRIYAGSINEVLSPYLASLVPPDTRYQVWSATERAARHDSAGMDGLRKTRD